MRNKTSREPEAETGQGERIFFNGRVGDDKRKTDYDGIDVLEKGKEKNSKKDGLMRFEGKRKVRGDGEENPTKKRDASRGVRESGV